MKFYNIRPWWQKLAADFPLFKDHQILLDKINHRSLLANSNLLGERALLLYSAKKDTTRNTIQITGKI
jgi:hypothetical protein